jgi:hypothetical protein
VQTVHAPPSSEHSKVEFDSLELKLNGGPPDASEVFGGVVSAVHVRVAGEASTLPAASRARTRKVWEPADSPVTLRGEVQAAQAPLSIWHSNVAPASLEVKVNGGPPEPSVVFGATLSAGWIVHSCSAGVGSGLPASSIARTSKRCAPVPRPLYICGLVQLSTHALCCVLFRRHW